MRTVLLVALLPTAVGCSAAGTATVRTTGPIDQTKPVLDYIRAAERGKAASFSIITGRSADAMFDRPEIADVDRTDQGRVLASVEANTRMVLAVWTCRGDEKRNVQRTFLIEGGRVTQTWNDRAELPLIFPLEKATPPVPAASGDPS